MKATTSKAQSRETDQVFLALPHMANLGQERGEEAQSSMVAIVEGRGESIFC